MCRIFINFMIMNFTNDSVIILHDRNMFNMFLDLIIHMNMRIYFNKGYN